MSPENQWLENVFATKIVHFFGTCLFSGVYVFNWKLAATALAFQQENHAKLLASAGLGVILGREKGNLWGELVRKKSLQVELLLYIEIKPWLIRGYSIDIYI